MRLFSLGLLIVLFPVASEAQTWWSSDYDQRQIIQVTTGENVPDKGYDGYIVRLSGINTASWVGAGQLRPDCNDLRVVHWDGVIHTEIPRHVLQCNTANSDIRFMMIADQGVSTTTSDYYLYYDHSAAAAPTALGTDNVYLWWDDGSVDRLSTYNYGRFDDLVGDGYYDGMIYDAAGHYYYNTGEGNNFGVRKNVQERDVYVEVETFHFDCHPDNMLAGPVVRARSGRPALRETSQDYYAGLTGQQNSAGCNAGGYPMDGDIVSGDTGNTVVDGVNPPAITNNQWRRTALASWRINPTHLSYYMENNTNSWEALGYPSGANLHVTGLDNNDSERRGNAGYAATQDRAALRRMLIRRYILPEPTLALIPEVNGELQASKSLEVYDPSGLGLYMIPGNDIIYTLDVSNVGGALTDADSIVLIDALPNEVEFYNGDIDDGGAELNPVSFEQSAGAGLLFNYSSDVAYTDSLTKPTAFVDCSYTPSAGYDATVTFICFNPKGAMASGDPDPNFSVSYRARLR